MDHIELLLSISELNALLDRSVSLPSFLDRCVETIARHFRSQVCSIYLYDPAQKRLTLSATRGLTHLPEKPITLGLGEGLTGLALKELRPIMTSHGSSHPAYRYFPGLGEERFDAFLAMPITRGIERIGVIVVQRDRDHPFNEAELRALRGVANQLASMIDHARLILLGASEATSGPQGGPVVPSFIKGTGASGGWAHGNVIIDAKTRELSTLLKECPDLPLDREMFMAAYETTVEQLSVFQKRIEKTLADEASLIFAAHLLLLKDDHFTGKILEKIDAGAHAGNAVVTVALEYIASFNRLDNPYLRQKADDLRDVAIRLLCNLYPGIAAVHDAAGRIVVAQDLLPSDLLIYAAENASGIVLIGGGETSHIAILARSLRIPMVIVDEAALLSLTSSNRLLIDADTGNCYVDPRPEIIAPYRQRPIVAPGPAHDGPCDHNGRTTTADGTAIAIMANINLIADVADAQRCHAAGIGLYRTEFPFIIRNAFPSEEEQYVVYRKVISRLPGVPIVFRTLDIGGDKVLPYYGSMHENNPFLGMRSLRFCLHHPDVFKQQLRAMLRAGHEADLRIMFPMVASLDELLKARGMLHECAAQLRAEGVPFHPDPAVGIMVELPATIEIIDDLARHAAFFSIGTNDLVQYLLAVDRTNEKVRDYYCPHHPSVLRAIKKVAEAAKRHGKEVSVCGDMAHNAAYAEFLIGIGITTLSVDPCYFGRIRTAVSAIDTRHAQALASRLLACSRISETDALLNVRS